MSIGYFRGLASDEIGATRSIKFGIGERDFSFAPKSSITKTDSIESRGSFDVRFAYEPFDFFWSGSGAMNNQQYTNVKY